MEQDSSASVENDAVENEILLRESKVLGIEIGTIGSFFSIRIMTNSVFTLAWRQSKLIATSYR